MKCPACGRQQPARRGMTCSGCKYQFTFNPKESATPGLTDGRFISAIETAGKNSITAFTDNQLYSAYAAKARSSRIAVAVLACIVGAVGIFVRLQEPRVGSVLLVVAALILIASLFAGPQVLSRKKFLPLISRWLDQGKPIDGLIREPGLHTPPETWHEADLYDYGAERILIVQRDLLVDLMVRNDQHTEQRMLVIAESGYPQYLIPHVNRLLEERPDLPLYLLHDADVVGSAMAQRVRSLPWLKLHSHPIVDLGFFPQDVDKLKSTRGLRNQRFERGLPADALLMGTLTTGMAACFASQSSLADEILFDWQNRMDSGSSFG